MGYAGCPNKWNVYHECVPACQNKWGAGKTQPDPEYADKHKRMMARYGPLPDSWKEQYDPGTGRHYYWCTRTNRVSWLPPGHPKARVTEAASEVRELVHSQLHLDEDDDDEAMELDSDMESDEETEHQQRREPVTKRRSRGGSDKVDPMDPSSYSDTPRGTWSSGLEQANS